ncbi:G-protein coupled receptor moody-like [Dreissena polymorpha]|uniref:G-protein coupled receptors family 1 profile domain-containing protein n=1 Tax=Dreissena polymorpha TaxID=45954 RepID=A0A9D4IHZ4_DREPO|nr:G-protein coupled receptor moody-like [Dreissena polymorpha]KAH3773212.1 hypothetical protein DPMN_174569 [Dreissena polymorpha]
MDSNVTSASNVSYDVIAILRERTLSQIELHIPVLCFIALLMLIGTFGNILVICTYVKRVTTSSTNLFIFCLAIFDLVNCTVALPLQIYSLLKPFTNEHELMCRFQNFMAFAADMSSGFIIVCISFDRYLRIMRPHQGLSVKNAKIAVAVTCIMSVAISSLALIVYGRRKVMFDDIPEVHGHQCGVADDKQETIIPVLFNTMILVCFVIAVIILLIVYTMLGIKVKRWSQVRKSKQSQAARASEYFGATAISDNTESPDSPEAKMSETFNFIPSSPRRMLDTDFDPETEPAFRRPAYVRELSRSLDKHEFLKLDAGHVDDALHVNGMQTLPVRKPKKPVASVARKPSMPSLNVIKRRMKVSKTTIMFISATVAFVASHLPYACTKILRTINPIWTKDFSDAGYSMFLFLEYSFVVSYAANPIIYSFLNPKYRRECKSLLQDISKTIKCHSEKFYFR